MMEDKSQTLKVEVIKSQPDSRNRTDSHLRKMVFIKQGNIDGILHMSKFWKFKKANCASLMKTVSEEESIS